MDDKPATPDLAIARLAHGQHGVVTRDQLLVAGLTKDAIHSRVRTGRLHPVHRRVYAVGHLALSDEARWLAAVLAVGDDSALSHRAAAEHVKLLPPSEGDVDAIIAGTAGRDKRSGIRIHRSRSLTAEEIVVRDGIRVTTPARTLRDLKRVVSATVFRKAARQAEVLGYELGVVAVDGTRSELEYMFLRMCARHHLPKPEVNVRVGPFLVDFLWRQKRLVVETDGRRYHRGVFASAEDDARDRQPERWGYQVRRFTHRQVTRQAAWVAATVREALAVAG